MSKPIDFGKAALAAYKKRTRCGGDIELLDARHPAAAAARLDPSVTVVDSDWVESVMHILTPRRWRFVVELAERVALRIPAGLTPTTVYGCAYAVLRAAEARGELAQWLTEGSK